MYIEWLFVKILFRLSVGN